MLDAGLTINGRPGQASGLTSRSLQSL